MSSRDLEAVSSAVHAHALVIEWQRHTDMNPRRECRAPLQRLPRPDLDGGCATV
jgi:hypothetical protein